LPQKSDAEDPDDKDLENPAEQKLTALTFEHLEAIFSVWTIGVALSSVVFILEWILHFARPDFQFPYMY